MQVWNMLYAARWKYRMHKIAKNSPSGYHHTSLSRCVFATKTCIDSWKKVVKQQYLLHMSLQYGELQSISGWDQFISLGHPSKFQQVSHVGFVPAPMSLSERQPYFAWCLAVSWAGTLYIHFRGLLPANWILPGAKFTSRPSLAFCYIGTFGSVLLHGTRAVAGWPSRWALAHMLVV